MPKTQRIMWTVLPNGLTEDGNRARASVLVSPELTLTDDLTPRLSEFPDWLDWPAVLADANLALELDGTVIDVDRVSTADSTVWAALFGPNTFVRPRVFEQMTDRRVLSYPAGLVHDYLQTIYAETAAQDLRLRPSANDLRNRLDEISDELLAPREVFREVANKGIRELRSSVRGAFSLFRAFHTPLERVTTASYQKTGPEDPREDASWTEREPVALPSPDSFQETIDFHRIVSSMNQYRGLLRSLGLVIDLEFDAAALGGASATPAMRVVADWTPRPEADTGVETFDNRTPFTRCLIASDRFEPQTRTNNSPLSRRTLRLSDERFRLLQSDVDGGAFKALGFVASLANLGSQDAFADIDEGEDAGRLRLGLPALRSDGLTLFEADRALSLEDIFQRSANLNADAVANSDIALFAEDLSRGLCIDVFDAGRGSWHSLCRRDIGFRFVDGTPGINQSDDEAMVRMATTRSSDGENETLLKLPEAVVAWTGWSLVAPPVGQGIDLDDQPAPLDPTTPPELPLETDVSVTPRTLPVLRFGSLYMFRARLVDLAHNALPFTPQDIPDTETSNAVTYRRFEPVESPGLALVSQGSDVPLPQRGGSMSAMVIRSFNDTPDLNMQMTDDREERHLVPPAVSADFAITHGVLDEGGRINPASFDLLSTRDGMLNEVVANGDSETRSATRYAYAPEGFALPFLPDPMARGIRAHFEGIGFPETELFMPLDDLAPWPDLTPIRIRLVEGSPSAVYDAGSRVMQVALPKAAMVRLRLSHTLQQDDLERLGLWDWRTLIAGPPSAEDIDDARSGRAWMLTPEKKMRLFHAVQKPLTVPTPGPITVQRGLGRKRARLSLDVQVDAASTSRLDVAGTWVEVRDDPQLGPPEVRQMSGEGRDTRVRRVVAQNGILAITPAHDQTDMRYRRVDYTVTAVSRYRPFMPLDIATDRAATSVSAAPRPGWIPSAAPPPPPVIHSVVPTFGWTRRQDADGGRSFRTAGLRVYLRRPWMVTGTAEMLAVVLPDGTSDVPPALATKVTRWGSDPIWEGAPISTETPPASAFPLRHFSGPLPPGTLAPSLLAGTDEDDLEAGAFRLTGLKTPDLAARPETVSVVPHAVDYDAEQDLWYCDIAVDADDRYYPFLRCGFARYQPISSVDDEDGRSAHLSNIVQADIIQVAPNRLVTLRPDGPGQFEVSVFGVTPTDPGDAPRRASGGHIDIEIQRRAGGPADDIDWVSATGGSVDAVTGNSPSTAPGDTPGSITSGAVGSTRRTLAESLLSAGDLPSLLSRFDLVAEIAPPLIARFQVTLPSTPAATPLRILVSEFEQYPVDTATTNARQFRDPEPNQRLIFAEAFELTSGGDLPITFEPIPN